MKKKQLEEFASNLGQIKKYKEERTMSENVGENVYSLTTWFDIDECCFAETIWYLLGRLDEGIAIALRIFNAHLARRKWFNEPLWRKPMESKKKITFRNINSWVFSVPKR